MPDKAIFKPDTPFSFNTNTVALTRTRSQELLTRAGFKPVLRFQNSKQKHCPN
jgi:hypothetical protein